MLHEFKSITQLQKAFPDEQSCIEYLVVGAFARGSFKK